MGFSVVVGKDIIFLWVENAMAETFFFFFKYFLVQIDCNDASNRSVFALIPKLTQDNQNKIKQEENKGYDLGVST